MVSFYDAFDAGDCEECEYDCAECMNLGMCQWYKDEVDEEVENEQG